MNKKFVWQKWIDPLNSNIEDFEHLTDHPNSSDVEDIKFYDFSESNVAAAKNVDENFFDNLKRKFHKVKPVSIVNTKFGLLTVTESTLADYHFDFWVLHTNFPISEEVANVIVKTPGVDAFNPLTRYRCKIGFPTSGLFNISDVKIDIQNNLINMDRNELDLIPSNPVFDDQTNVLIENKIQELKSRSKYWALYVLPNGNIEMLESDSNNSSYFSKLKVFEESQKMIGGKIFKS